MRYNGGKTRIAKQIAPIVNADRAGRFCWEPFCGGLGMTEHLKPDLASDVHPGLIALYNKLRAEPNWLDGFECSEADYTFAKTLPDDSPIKAFIGFGCSFGGKWFGGYGRQQTDARHPHSLTYSGAKTLTRKIRNTQNVAMSCGSFFDVEPRPGFLIYCDPPYRGTTIAGAVRVFDFDRFDQQVIAWVRARSVVYVSEYGFPFGDVVWHGSPQCSLGSGVPGGQSGRIGEGREERLYRCAL